MTIHNVLTLLFGSGTLIPVSAYFVKRIKATEQKNEAIALGVQALLRDRLIEQYNHYSEKGFAPIYAKENFRNMWEQYHSLGVNGVMDELQEKFMDLPEKPEKERV